MSKLTAFTAAVVAVTLAGGVVTPPAQAQSGKSSNFSAAVRGLASASANVTYVDEGEIRVNSLSVSDLRADPHSVYAYFVVYNSEGSTAATRRRYNLKGAGTTQTWKNLRITDEHGGLRKLQLVVCVDDWGPNTCRGSGVQVNPRF